MHDDPRGGRQAWLAALAGAAMAGLAFGLADATWGALRAPGSLALADQARIVASGAIGGLGAGAVVGGLLGLAAVPLGRRPRWAWVLASFALIGLLADGLLYRRLYAELHGLLGAGAFLAAAAAGALARTRRVGWVLAVAVPTAVAGPSFLAALLGDGHRLRQVVSAETTFTGRLASLVAPIVEGGIATQCTWPAAAPVASRGAASDASFLLITVDALRGDLGQKLDRVMPKTHARLASAVRFERAYTAATRTAQSTYSLLTGRWPHRLRFSVGGVDPNDRFKAFDADDARLTDPRRWRQRHRFPMHDRTPTLAGLLGAAGWSTATFISYVYLQPGAGITREFALADPSVYRAHNRDNRGVTSAALTDATLAWLPTAEGRTFVWLHYMDPHSPYVPYTPRLEGQPMKPRYLGELRRVDDALDRLLAGVDLSRTVVILTADHGEAFGEHGGNFHGSGVYEEELHVPLLIQVPGGAARRIGEPVSLVDVAPTIVDLAGIATPTPFDGRSLASALTDGTVAPRPVLGQTLMDGLTASVTDGGLKLIADFRSRTLELYDLGADPRERQNLVDARPADSDRLQCLLEASGVKGLAQPGH